MVMIQMEDKSRFFIFKLNNEKTEETKKVSELQAQVDKLNKTVNDLQEKNEINSKVIGTEENSKTTLSENEILKVLKEKFEVAEKIYLSPDIFFNVKAGEEIKDFDNTILKYGTENILKEIKKNLPMCVKLDNGKYYFIEGGGAREYAGFGSFENIKATDSTITATLKTKQTKYNGTDWVSANDKSSEFVLVKKGNEWLIDKINSSDFN